MFDSAGLAPEFESLLGVDHAAYPTADPAATIEFYRDILGFPVAHCITAAGWGVDPHPDFVHFFFDIGSGNRLAFFYYFGFDVPQDGVLGDVHARFADDVPGFFIRSRHLAIGVDSAEALQAYADRLNASRWPVEMRVRHETIESIYTTDPNGYMFEVTQQLRPVLPGERLDAELTLRALVDALGAGDDNLAAVLSRKAELIEQLPLDSATV